MLLRYLSVARPFNYSSYYLHFTYLKNDVNAK